MKEPRHADVRPKGRAADCAYQSLELALEFLAEGRHAAAADEIRDVMDQLCGWCDDKYDLDDGTYRGKEIGLLNPVDSAACPPQQPPAWPGAGPDEADYSAETP